MAPESRSDDAAPAVPETGIAEVWKRRSGEPSSPDPSEGAEDADDSGDTAGEAEPD